MNPPSKLCTTRYRPVIAGCTGAARLGDRVTVGRPSTRQTGRPTATASPRRSAAARSHARISPASTCRRRRRCGHARRGLRRRQRQRRRATRRPGPDQAPGTCPGPRRAGPPSRRHQRRPRSRATTRSPPDRATVAEATHAGHVPPSADRPRSVATGGRAGKRRRRTHGPKPASAEPAVDPVDRAPARPLRGLTPPEAQPQRPRTTRVQRTGPAQHELAVARAPAPRSPRRQLMRSAHRSSSNVNSTTQSTDRLDSFAIDSTAASPSQPFVPTSYRALTVSPPVDPPDARPPRRRRAGHAGARRRRPTAARRPRRHRTPLHTSRTRPTGRRRRSRHGRQEHRRRGLRRASRSLVRNDSSAITRSTTSAHTPSSTTIHGTDANTRAARVTAAPSGRTAIRSPLVPTDATA